MAQLRFGDMGNREHLDLPRLTSTSLGNTLGNTLGVSQGTGN